MAARILFGVFGFAFVLLALFVFPPMVLEVALALLGALATFEVIGSTGLVNDKKLLNICVIVSFINGLGYARFIQTVGVYLHQLLPFLLLVTLFALVLRFHNTVTAIEAMYGMFAALLLPYFLLSLTRIFQMENGKFLVLMPLLAAWGSDTFALFAGICFGKHKLAPVVSPKKTIEGAIGGMLGSVFCLLLFALIMHHTIGFNLPYWVACLLGIGGSILGQVGDLSFSILKRQTGIKDYGSIFPGHGGILDRFDSVIFVAPAVELVLQIFNA